MNVKYDIVADAIYFRVGEAKVARAIKMENRFLVDMDRAGNVVGIEILDASSQEQLVQNLKRQVKAGVPIDIVNTTPMAA